MRNDTNDDGAEYMPPEVLEALFEMSKQPGPWADFENVGRALEDAGFGDRLAVMTSPGRVIAVVYTDEEPEPNDPVYNAGAEELVDLLVTRLLERADAEFVAEQEALLATPAGARLRQQIDLLRRMQERGVRVLDGGRGDE